MKHAVLIGLLSAASLSSGAGAEPARTDFAEAKRQAYEANYRNDQAGLRQAIEKFEKLAAAPELAAPALYHAAWTRWVLAASENVAANPAAAIAALEAGVKDLKRGLELQPEDAEMHALMAWSLMGIASNDRSKWGAVATDMAQHRKKAVALAPKNPRVLIMDAGMLFYTPPEAGGGQDKAIALWLEALKLFDEERPGDATRVDWGGALPYGWLANLYLQTSPPRMAEAGKMAKKALELQPDFWWVKTQVVPKIAPADKQ
jgi:tetratricopeptide (TPR) repeat protein